jgi:NAD-dependent SIR2 family protein deacetylase
MNPSEPFDRNVYILGAGFSAAAGAPLIHNFLDVASALWEDPEAPLSEDQRIDFGRVFEFRREMARAREKVRIDLDNVEHLFGLIDIAERITPHGASPRLAILTLIATTLELKIDTARLPSIGFMPRNPIPPHIVNLPTAYARGQYSHPPEYRTNIYSQFAALVGGLLDPPEKGRARRDTIVTFNYDLVVDRALRAMGFEINYQLPGTKPIADAPAVSVIKLHGSINWTICRGCGKVKISPPEDRLSANATCAECRQRFVPLLIPPSWNKASSNALGTDALFSLWSAADEALSTASRICVIGYSVPETDAFFRYLLTLALSRNHHLSTFLVVDPAPQVNEKFQALLEPIFLQRRYLNFCCPLEQALAMNDFYQKLRRGTEIGHQLTAYGRPPK